MNKQQMLEKIFAADAELCKGVRIVAGKVEDGDIGFSKSREAVPDIIQDEAGDIRGRQAIITAVNGYRDKLRTNDDFALFDNCVLLAWAGHLAAQNRQEATATPAQMSEYILRNEARLKQYIRNAVSAWLDETL